MRDPLLVALFASTMATLLILAERRLRSRLTALDTWAAGHGLLTEKMPGVGALSAFEPLALLPPVVAVQRLMRGTLRTQRFTVEVTLAVCLNGNRHRPRRYLIGIFASHPDLPPLRVLPVLDREAPSDLGFVPLPATALPPGYQAEAYQPLQRALTEALGAELRAAGPNWRLELRPGRLILATPVVAVDQIEALMILGTQLQLALIQAMQQEERPAGPPPDGPPPHGGRWLN